MTKLISDTARYLAMVLALATVITIGAQANAASVGAQSIQPAYTSAIGLPDGG